MKKKKTVSCFVFDLFLNIYECLLKLLLVAGVSSTKQLNPNIIYDNALHGDQAALERAESLWGEIHRTIHSVVSRFEKKGIIPRQDQDAISRVEELQKILMSYHKRMGILTPKTIENIEYLTNGSIMSGQQPVMMGGPGFIGNKLSLLHFLSEQLASKGIKLAPVFLVADYDGLHKELVRTYLPNPLSEKAHIVDIWNALDYPEGTAFHRVNAPEKSWLNETLEEIERVTQEFRTKVKGEKKKILALQEQLIFDLWKLSYAPNEKMRDWFTKIWGYQTNEIHDWGIVYFPFGEKEIRKLIAPFYLPFILEHHKYAKAFQEATERLESLGYKPSLRKRDDHSAPFFFECPHDGIRVDPKLEHREDDNTISVIAECQHCGEVFGFTGAPSPDGLVTHASSLNARVDSASAVVQEILNPQVRISGPGELAYYAQVRYATIAVGFRAPIFVKYKRAFYNAPWIESLGKQLAKRGLKVLHTPEFFKLLSKWVKAKKNEHADEVLNAEIQIAKFIQEVYDELRNNRQKKDISKYLSWQFGSFNPTKFGQEVSWLWFDMARITGLWDYLTTYERMYTPYSSFGVMTFLNTGP